MCLFPVRAMQEAIADKHTGMLVKFGRPKVNSEGDLLLPCGKCTECISKRSVEWAIRCRHEISCHRENCFLTLTYDEKTVPDHSEIKNEFQKFMKRLRKHLKKNIRYIVSHEFGAQFKRPHHHAIIFGWDPLNQIFLKTTKSGERLFTSDEVSKLWKFGYHSIGTANEKTAYYIASYALKGKLHETTTGQGEIINLKDSMDCSRRPAIGYNYLIDNMHQLASGSDLLPRYYIKKLKELNPQLHERYENNQSTLLKTRSSHELLAKYVLDQQKLSLHGEFRELEQNIINENSHLKAELLTNRDAYQLSKTQG